MTCGVYFIRSKVSGKMYVGSATNIEQRTHAHRGALRRREHRNSRLSGAYAKAGSLDVFEFGVLEECVEADLRAREQHWVDILKPNYNIYVKDVRSNKGAVVSPEARAKLSAARKAHLDKPGVREQIGAQAKARWADPEVRAKASAGAKASWTEAKREAARQRGNGEVGKRLVSARAIRWGDPEARDRQSAMMKVVRAKKARTYEDVEAMVAAADPQWRLQAASGTKTKDKITIYCAKHAATHEVTVNMLVSRKQGCRLCGWERSSVKQKKTIG